MSEKIEYMKVFKKTITLSKNVSFDTFFGYFMRGDKDNLSEVTTPANKAVTIHIKFGKELYENVKEEKFPILIHLQEQGDSKTPHYFYTKDKDKDGNVKYDKNGNFHYILVILDSDDICEAPKTNLLDTYQIIDKQ